MSGIAPTTARAWTTSGTPTVMVHATRTSARGHVEVTWRSQSPSNDDKRALIT